MSKIIYNLVYNRKKCLNKKGMALVQVEAYLDRKKKYFSTKVYLKPEQWDTKKLVVKNHPNADALNRLIYEYMSKIEKKELELWQQGRRISLELLKDVLGTSENKTSFIPFFRQEVTNSALKESTKRNHLSTLTLLQEFKKDVSFSDLTFEFISSFEYFLQSKGYHTNTIAKHMKHLKRHINVAINVSSGLGVFSFSSFWTIKELFEQRERVLKGWFPMNPQRKHEYEAPPTDTPE